MWNDVQKLWWVCESRQHEKRKANEEDEKVACQEQDGGDRLWQKNRRFSCQFDFMNLYFEFISNTLYYCFFDDNLRTED